IVIFNHALSPSQERNLERLLSCRVLARTGLILDIFAQRARSFEGKLQVELAQLRHLSTRLVRGWTHLERQKGGIGLRGPGETQLESDRRMINARIKMINKRLEKVERQRDQGRRARSRADVPSVSLVGYTNAGKSTLFNAITGAHAYTADQMFATLDPTLRRIELRAVGPLVLADTVGFIRHLPHDLVAAFRATLEETRKADLLLHVVDVQDADRGARIEQVNEVLREIGADKVPQLCVYNKIDLNGMEPRVERDPEGRITRIWLSAMSGNGLDLLSAALTEYFEGVQVHGWLHLSSWAGAIRSSLFEMGCVLSEHVDEQGDWWLEVRMARRDVDRLTRDPEQGVRFHSADSDDLLAGTA
ncbi:MAG: GTPase HflX, partial [Halobacteria archaeon]|nr:GTPase HflX [Halobacteria archaeon]